MHPDLTPVLEIGGTHLTAALVDPATWSVVPASTTRIHLHADGSAEQLVGEIARGAHTLGVQRSTEWVVAIPGPFDYERGIGLFENVGKFDSLRGVDVRAALQDAIEPRPAFVHFLNDADAFGVGEFAGGAARGAARAVCITLGTGIGSAYLVDGEPTNDGPGVPPEGSAHLIQYKGRPLEETVSRRAILAGYATAVGGAEDAAIDVREIAELAREGRKPASQILNAAFSALGVALAGSLHEFGATRLVIGGSMARSWDIVEPAIRLGLSSVFAEFDSLEICQAQRPDDAPLVGAAFWAARHHRPATVG